MSNSSENIINVNSSSKLFKLADVASVNAGRINERKSVNMRLAKHYYKKSNDLKILGRINEREQKRANRVYSCCLQRYVVVVNNQSYNVFTHRCRDRHCAECQRIKAFIWQQKIEQISDQLVKLYAKDGAIFGTLTIKNPPIKDLNKYLKVMSRAFARMLRRKAFAFARGGFVALKSREVGRVQATVTRTFTSSYRLVLSTSRRTVCRFSLVSNGRSIGLNALH